MKLNNETTAIITNNIKLSDNEIYLELYQASDGDNDNPPTYRFCIKKHNDNGIVGRCSFRVGDTDNRHIKYGGNIGYDIDEPYRGNKYSLKACRYYLFWRKIMECSQYISHAPRRIKRLAESVN